MKILKRFLIAGTPVSIIETEDEIYFESKLPKHIVEKYAEDEGILEEILTGNESFEQTIIEI